MKVDGTCHCGRVTYAADLDPAGVLVCHCTDCQTLSGSAFRTVALTKPGGPTLFAPATGQQLARVQVRRSR